MRNNGDDRVGVPLRLKVESPVTIYSGLPNIIGLIIFLGPKRGVAKVLSQQANLLVKSFLHGSSSTVALNSPDAFTTLAFESGQHFGGTGKGPVDPALLEVVQSLRNGPRPRYLTPLESSLILASVLESKQMRCTVPR